MDLELVVEDPFEQLRPVFLERLRDQIAGLGVSIGSPAHHELRIRAGRIAVEVGFDGSSTQVPFDVTRRVLAEEHLRQVILAGVSSTFDGFEAAGVRPALWVVTVAGASGPVIEGVGYQLGASGEALRWWRAGQTLRVGVVLYGRYLFETGGSLPGGGSFGVRELTVAAGAAMEWPIHALFALELRVLAGLGRVELEPRAGPGFRPSAATVTLQGLGRSALGARFQLTRALSLVLSGAFEVLPSALDLEVDGRSTDQGGELRPAFDLGLSVHF